VAQLAGPRLSRGFQSKFLVGVWWFHAILEIMGALFCIQFAYYLQSWHSRVFSS